MNLIDSAIVHVYKSCGSATDFAYKKIDGIDVFKSGINCPFVNYALVSEKADNQSLIKVLDYFGNIPFMLDATSTKFQVMLKKLGFSTLESAIGMILDLERWKVSDWNTTLEVVEVDNKGRLSDFIEIEAEGFGVFKEVLNTFFTSIFNLKDQRFFVVYHNGKPISVLQSSFCSEIVFISWITTHPLYRRQGAANAIVTAALIEAQRKGLKRAALQSSKMGLSVYQKLGFEVVGEYSVWKKT